MSDNEKELSKEHIRLKEELGRINELDDPLDVYLEYIEWIKRRYPQETTNESKLMSAIKTVTEIFANDLRYKYSPRYLKHCLQYSKWVEDPQEVYDFLMLNGIGQNLALFYEDYASYLEQESNYIGAKEVYKYGVSQAAVPKDRLKKNFQQFKDRMKERNEEEKTTIEQSNDHTKDKDEEEKTTIEQSNDHTKDKDEQEKTTIEHSNDHTKDKNEKKTRPIERKAPRHNILKKSLKIQRNRRKEYEQRKESKGTKFSSSSKASQLCSKTETLCCSPPFTDKLDENAEFFSGEIPENNTGSVRESSPSEPLEVLPNYISKLITRLYK